jgi:protein TonB
MRWWAALGYGLSVAVHFGLAAGVSSIRKDHPRKATVVKVFEAKREKKKEPEPEKKEAKPPPPKKAEPPPQPKNTPPPPTNTSPTPAGHEAMAALPDFGIALGGGVEGGIAVPVAGMAANAAAQHARGAAAPSEKKVRGPAPKPTDAADACVEEPIKPKALERVTPQASDEAKASNIEGVVTVECTVSASGEVVDARVTSGLGHGLDENAVVAAKRWKFSPATKCGKPIEAKYVIRMRFVAGD